jgi:hypothetical protein
MAMLIIDITRVVLVLLKKLLIKFLAFFST